MKTTCKKLSFDATQQNKVYYKMSTKFRNKTTEVYI